KCIKYCCKTVKTFLPQLLHFLFMFFGKRKCKGAPVARARLARETTLVYELVHELRCRTTRYAEMLREFLDADVLFPHYGSENCQLRGSYLLAVRGRGA